MNLIENYLKEINNSNLQYLSEDIKSIVMKLKDFNLKSIISSLQTSAKSKDLNKIKHTINSIKIPTLSNDNIITNMKKIFPEFQKSFELSKKVIGNSVPNLSEKSVESVAIAVAVKSIYKSDKPMDDTKENLITAVSQLRKYVGTGAESDIGATLGVVIVVIFLIAGIAVVASYGFATLVPLIIVGALLMVLKNLLSE